MPRPALRQMPKHALSGVCCRSRCGYELSALLNLSTSRVEASLPLPSRAVKITVKLVSDLGGRPMNLPLVRSKLNHSGSGPFSPRASSTTDTFESACLKVQAVDFACKMLMESVLTRSMILAFYLFLLTQAHVLHAGCRGAAPGALFLVTLMSCF